jgi:hypothetical protein
VETAKRGDALRTTLVLKIGLKKFLSINFLENKKDKCSHLVIWTFTLSIIRIEKLFAIGN